MAELKVDRLVGLLDYRGMTVRYMPHMPELQGVSGKARYEGGALHFDIASGATVGLQDGRRHHRPHRTRRAAAAACRHPHADHRLGAGCHPLPGAAQARPAARTCSTTTARLGGEVAIDLSLGFPLLNSLTVADLDIKAEASLSRFSLQDAIGDVDLTDATARVKYGSSEMNVSGTGKLDGNAVEIGWRELFGAKVPFRRRYELKGTVPAELVAKAGFPSPEPYLSGPIGTTLHYQVATNGTGEVVGRFDIKGAKADVAPLVWTKQPGVEGQVQLTMKLAAGGKLTTIDFDGRANGLSSKGQVRFAGDNALQQITLQQFKIGQTDVAGDWKRVPGRRRDLAARPLARTAARARMHEGARRSGGQGARRGRGCHGADQHQDDPAAPAGPDRARHAGLRQWPARPGRRAHRLRRPVDRRGQGLDLPRHAGRAGPQALPLRRRLRPDAEGCGLARRAGRRLPRTSRASTTTLSPARRSTASSSSGPTGWRG